MEIEHVRFFEPNERQEPYFEFTAEGVGYRASADKRATARGHWFIPVLRIIAGEQAAHAGKAVGFAGLTQKYIKGRFASLVANPDPVLLDEFSDRLQKAWFEASLLHIRKRKIVYRVLHISRLDGTPIHCTERGRGTDRDTLVRARKAVRALLPPARRDATHEERSGRLSPRYYKLGVPRASTGNALAGALVRPPRGRLDDALEIARQLKVPVDSSVAKLREHHGGYPLGRFLALWIADSNGGLGPYGGYADDRVIVRNAWDSEEIGRQREETGATVPPGLPHRGEPYKGAIREALKLTAVHELIGPPIKSKCWLASWIEPHDDSYNLQLVLGGGDFREMKALEYAMEHPVLLVPDKKGGSSSHKVSLRSLVESGALDFSRSSPLTICTHFIARTNDDYLLVGQRADGDEIGYEHGAYSFSAAEQMDPSEENHPLDTVRRGMREEFDCKTKFGVLLDDLTVRLLSFGLEWGGGKNWSTCFIAAVDVDKSRDFLLDLRRRRRSSSVAEIPSLVAVPIGSSSARKDLVNRVIAESLNGNDYPDHDRAGRRFTPGRPLSTTSIASILLGLTHWYEDGVGLKRETEMPGRPQEGMGETGEGD